MRKAFFILNATVLFWISLVFAYGDTADAFVSKVVQQAGKKVVKEAIKDEAVKMSMNMVLNYKYTPPSDREIEKLNTPTDSYKPARNFGKMRKPKKGYAPVCLSKHRKKARINPKETIEYCEKPMEVKQTLTPADKNKVGDHVEKALDKATWNKGFMKFINFFVPFWIVGAASTVIDLLLDGELSNFFGNLAYDSLVAVGLLTPLGDDFERNDKPVNNTANDDLIISDEPIPDNDVSVPLHRLGTNYEAYQLPGNLFVDMHVNDKSHTIFYGNSFYGIKYLLVTIMVGEGFVDNTSDRLHITYFTPDIDIGDRYIRRIEVYKSSSYYRTTSTHLISSHDVSDQRIYLNRYRESGLNTNEIEHLLSLAGPIIDDMYADYINYVPPAMPEVRPDDVPISRPNTTIKIPSPESVPVIDKSTGKVVKPAPESTPDAPVWITPEGTPVPEDNITVGDITVTPTPDGNIINKPTPDSPLIEDIIPIDPTPTEPPVEEIPEPPAEFVCTDRLRKPRFDRLGQEISTTFPFNIPFDLKKSAENLFVNMGNERPNFSFDFDFLAKDELNHSFDVKLPKIFDEWRPVWQSLMVFAFDVALLYMIWRFIGGGS